MKLSDLKTFFHDRYCVLELEVEYPDYFKQGNLISIHENFSNYTVSHAIENGGERKECGACFKTKQYEIDYKAHSGNCICCVRQIYDRILLVEMLYNAEQILHDNLFPDGMSIAIVDEALKDATVAQFKKEFQKDYAFVLGQNTYYLVGKYLENKDEDCFILVNPVSKNYYTVVTKNLSDLQLVSDSAADSKKMLVIEKRQRPLCNISSYQFSLFLGKIHIVDKTLNAQLKAGTVSWIKNGGAKYVKIWSNYAEQEKQLVDENLEKAGVLKFSTCRKNEYGEWVFTIENSVAIAEFRQVVEKQFADEVIICLSPTVRYSGKLLMAGDKRNEIIISSEVQYIISEGTIVPNAAGSLIVYNRRKSASDAILSSDAVNPCIAEILDGERNSFAKSKQQEKLSLDEEILNNIFINGPTEEQRSAIEIALNTPDIAVIKGPPGTGKTRVIQAIFAHLQKYGKVKDKQSKFLITAYQNDATFNAVDGLKDGFGLPIFRYGLNSEEDNLRQLSSWCAECVERVSSNSDLAIKGKKRKTLKHLEFQRDAITKGCTIQQATDILTTFLQEVEEYLKEGYSHSSLNEVEELKTKVARQINNLGKSNSTDETVIKYYVANLPTSPEGIADSQGYISEFMASLYFAENTSLKKLVKELKEIVKKPSLQKSDYRRLKELKIQMALALGDNKMLSPQKGEEIVGWMNEIIDLLNAERLKTKDEILCDYIDEMQPTEELTEIIKKYQTISAATHQRTLGKDLYVGGQLPKFKAVLVDEAARSCPSDLLIPLACAEEKIILVGDEKQLPQFLDSTTVKKLASVLNTEDLEELKRALSGNGSANKSFFSVSMFEYLINKVATKFEERDGIKRVVMLDKQFRMPPTLGEFVSKEFYDGKLKNGIDFNEGRTVPERYRNDYPIINGLNLVWVDVPKKGNEQKEVDKSFFREAEKNAVFYILDKLQEKIRNSVANDKKTTIGIITGYNAQRRLICSELNNEKWDSIREYVEVGTIDSFQGKEFDIVFISAVRTQGYGFLSVKDMDSDDFTLSRAGKQRTCVALSRAKKCLIVVWDAAMVSGANEKKAMEEVPAFVELYKACKEQRDGVCKIINGMDMLNGYVD